MKEEKTKTKKKGLYYFLLIVSVLLLAAATVLTVYFATNNTDDLAENPPADDNKDDDDDKPEEPDEPTGGETLYVAPVEADGFSVEHNAVYANTITGFYYRHQGVDFAAEAGAEVMLGLLSGSEEERPSFRETHKSFLVKGKTTR